MKNGVKNIQAAVYNGALMVDRFRIFLAAKKNTFIKSCIKWGNFLSVTKIVLRFEYGTWNSNLKWTLMSKQWRKNCRAQNDATPALDLRPFFYKMKPQFKLKSISFFYKKCGSLFICVSQISQDLAEKVPKYYCENEKRPHHLGLKKGVPKTFIETKNLA